MTLAPDQEPVYRCTHCTRQLYRDELSRAACFVCEERAAKHLKELGRMYGQLADQLAPGATPNGARVSASKAAPLPVSLHILNLRGPGGIVTKLQAIEDSWRAELGWTVATFRGNAEQTLAKVIPFLINNLRWACDKYESVSEDLDVISRLHSQADNSVSGERKTLVPVFCRYLYDDQTECGAPMRIDIGKAVARCSTCGTRWGREEWVALYQATRLQAA